MVFKNIKKSCLAFLLMFLISLSANASESFEAKLLLKESTKEGNTLFKLEENIIYSNHKLNKNVKYNTMIKKLVEKVIFFESKYKNEALFFVESIEDKNKKLWTISTNVISNDTSVSQFTVSYDNKIVSGWINRNNKDIFGLRIFNF